MNGTACCRQLQLQMRRRHRDQVMRGARLPVRQAVHEDAAVRALHLHALVPCGRTAGLCAKAENQTCPCGKVSNYSCKPASPSSPGESMKLQQSETTSHMLSTELAAVQGRLRRAALAPLHQHRSMRLSSQAPLCHFMPCKPLQCLLLSSGCC